MNSKNCLRLSLLKPSLLHTPYWPPFTGYNYENIKVSGLELSTLLTAALRLLLLLLLSLTGLTTCRALEEPHLAS